MNWLKKIVAIGVLLPAITFGQTWPMKPIKLIVPFPPGGGVDYLARVLAKDLTDHLGTPIFVENISGANGALGAQVLARSAPDGYTVMMTSDGPVVASPSLYPALPYQPLRDFAPVALLAQYTCVLIAHPSFPGKNATEFLAMARSKPGSITFGSAGIGNFSHLAMELLQSTTGTKMTHVPYRGTAPALQGLLAGDTHVMYTTVAAVIDHIKAGKVKVLGVGDAKRSVALPETATIAETVPGFSYSGWSGLFFPANTPPAVVDRFARESAAFLKNPETVKLFVQQQMVADYVGPADFTKFIREEQGKWATLIKEIGIKAE